MAEWHLTPNYILHEMTEELLTLLFQKRNERVRAMNQPGEAHEEVASQTRQVSDVEFFNQYGVTPTVV